MWSTIGRISLQNLKANVPTIVIDVHLDTVAVGHMTDDPFDERVENGRVYGRGSVDTKATFAVVLDVLSQLRNDGRRRPHRSPCGTVSEEMGGRSGPPPCVTPST